MRFDLVDLQLFIAIARGAQHHGLGRPRASGAGFGQRADQGAGGSPLGTALLRRGRRGIELTAAGQSLLDHARIILYNVEAMRALPKPAQQLVEHLRKRAQ